jgi:pSer/pThr/pTyr-binding forkhead associated (FHA) protein
MEETVTNKLLDAGDLAGSDFPDLDVTARRSRKPKSTVPDEAEQPVGGLRIVAGPEGVKVGATIPLFARDVVTHLGRVTTNTIALNDPKVSKEHACITFDGRDHVIMDKNSTNGTFVNGRRVVGEVGQRLATGDRISFGDETFHDRTELLYARRTG